MLIHNERKRHILYIQKGWENHLIPSKLYLDSVVIATRKQKLHGWMPLNHFHILCMALQHCNTLKLIAGKYFPYPHSFISTTSRKQRPRRIPRHTFHFIFMTLFAKTPDLARIKRNPTRKIEQLMQSKSLSIPATKLQLIPLEWIRIRNHPRRLEKLQWCHRSLQWPIASPTVTKRTIGRFWCEDHPELPRTQPRKFNTKSTRLSKNR